jgi:hypothetical protein
VNLKSVVDHWTYCYHVTAAINLTGIRISRVLFPAATLFCKMGRYDLLSLRRKHDFQLRFQNNEILVRNQTSLDPDHIDFGWTETIEQYIACLNTHVFFWPGVASGPTLDGDRMFRRTGVKSVMIRVSTRSLLDTNGNSMVYLSSCNTGASWIGKDGKKSQRGIDVFQRAEAFSEPLEKIEEVLFRGPVYLPDDSECSISIGPRWFSLFTQP